MSLGEGMPFPRPGRFILEMQSVPGIPGGLAFPVIDVDVAGSFVLFGTSGVNANGREVELTITEHLLADYPGSSSPGLEYHFVFKMVGFDDFNWTWFYEREDPPGPDIDIVMMAASNVPTTRVLIVFDDPTLMNLDWPSQPVLGKLRWFPMSECYLFDDPDPVIDKAEFNGVDARIACVPTFAGNGFEYRWSGDFYIRPGGDAIWSHFSAHAFSRIGMTDTHLKFGAANAFSNYPLPKETWFTLRVQTFWDATPFGQADIFFDDVFQKRVAVGSGGGVQDSLGGRATAPVEWGDFDLRNLILEGGPSATPIIAIKMDMDGNACGSGPDLIKGTTFNMPLPSCP